ncbi:NmrA family NAD(P)-binding protein [Dyadobacter aurulentus]|uniref:NmrA family NAD(P)-binding protein n=1 Tax=Dyadobacter sp. UC 10 TaxID=2605428 RepID=UPI0011F0E60B|nr:NmrA family NAD(P)-binding protein [Dyadobacter sp. UC 10]KAA0991949.1 NAD(P)H-binding protein [Dyadobacter sp. UC 10]
MYQDLDKAGSSLIIVVGASGHLGTRITHYLTEKGAKVRALIRNGSTNRNIDILMKSGAEVIMVDFNDRSELVAALSGAACVVSALSGLREVIVDLQVRLVKAAVEAGVKRFIPSDYCIDYTKLKPGTNRNLDLRRDFSEILDQENIQATSILNGMFADLLTGQAPLVQFGLKKVIYWGSSYQPMDFTTIEDTAQFTAAAAMDLQTPRYLRVAGEVATVRDLAKAASLAKGKKFGIFRIGGLGLLAAMIKIARTLFPQKKEVFPAWQGMQYLHDMLSGLPKLHPLDNDRYPQIKYTRVHEVLTKS